MYFSAVCCQTIQSFGLTSDNIQIWMRCTFVKNIMLTGSFQLLPSTSQYTVIAMKIHGFSLGNDLQTVDFSIFSICWFIGGYRVSTGDKTVIRWAVVTIVRTRGPQQHTSASPARSCQMREVDDWVLGLHHKVSIISSLYMYIYII